jgi:urocanate hydratase
MSSCLDIGPQGIVHGTTLTILNAGRKYLGLDDLKGKVFVTSGLGGMSGAQPKAAKICGTISITAEVDEIAAKKRLAQGWVDKLSESLDEIVSLIKEHRKTKESISIAYVGNVIDLWERFATIYCMYCVGWVRYLGLTIAFCCFFRLAAEEEMLVELGSDQTSLHNPYGGGYYPAGISFAESNKLMYEQPEKFKELVQSSLVRHVTAINKLVARGMRFWDYGNSFLLEASRAGADIWKARSLLVLYVGLSATCAYVCVYRMTPS